MRMLANAAMLASGLVLRTAGPRAFCRRAEVPKASVAKHMSEVLFVECGFGCDQHGQRATKACVRACRSAIEFNSLPRMGQLVPGGYAGMRLHVQIGVPAPYIETVNIAEVKAVFPYGDVLVEIEPGGLLADSGIALPAMGDTNSDMIIAVACVSVGYNKAM